MLLQWLRFEYPTRVIALTLEYRICNEERSAPTLFKNPRDPAVPEMPASSSQQEARTHEMEGL